MRILHVSHRAESCGGAEAHLFALIDAQSARGDAPCLLAGHAEEEGERERVALVRRPPFDAARQMDDAAFLDAFDAAVARWRPSVVHLHQTAQLPVALYARARAAGVPLVQSLYDHALLCPSGWMVRGDGTPCAGGPGAKCLSAGCERHQAYDAAQVAASAWRLRFARSALDATVVGTDQLAALVRAQGLPDVRVVPYFRPRPSGAPDGVVRVAGRIACVARLEPEKGVDVLLDAFGALARERRDASLLLVGDGSRRGALERRAAELGVGQSVTFAGARDLAGVAEAIASAAVLAIPSVWAETMPLVSLDAFACGTPVVASDVGGMAFAVRDGTSGLLVPPRDARALAAALARVLSDDPLARRLADGGTARLAVFDRERHLDALAALYAELLERPAASRRELAPSAFDAAEEWALSRALVELHARHEAKHVELMADHARERAWIRRTVGYVEGDPVTRLVNRLRRGPDLGRFLDDLGE